MKSCLNGGFFFAVVFSFASVYLLLLTFEALLLLGFRNALFNLFAVIICEPILGTKMPFSF